MLPCAEIFMLAFQKMESQKGIEYILRFKKTLSTALTKIQQIWSFANISGKHWYSTLLNIFQYWIIKNC